MMVGTQWGLVDAGGGHWSPFIDGGCRVVVILGDGGVVMWQSMGLGEVVSSGQGAVVVLGNGGQ